MAEWRIRTNVEPARSAKENAPPVSWRGVSFCCCVDAYTVTVSATSLNSLI